MSTTNNIDYDALAAQARTPPQPQQGGQPDYDALAAQARAPQGGTDDLDKLLSNLPDTQQPTSWMGRTWQSAKDVAQGANVASRQIPVTLAEAAEKIPGVGKMVSDYIATHPEEQQFIAAAKQAPTNTSQSVGAGLWNVAEFVAGEGALKTLTMAQRVKHILPALETMEKYPRLASIVRQAMVGTGQGLAHGDTLPRALESGAVAGGTGAIMEGLGAGASSIIRRIRPGTANILGETVPELASQRPGASPMAESIADIRSEPQTATAQQEGANRGIINRAQRAAATELHRLNAARTAQWIEGEGVMNLAPEPTAEPLPADRRLPSGQAQLPEATASAAPQLEGGAEPSGLSRTDEMGQYEGDFPDQTEQGGTQQQPTPATEGAAPGQRVSYIEEHPPNFQPVDVGAETQNIRSFGDAADVIRKHAAPIFDRFDKLTGGEYVRLRNLRDEAYAAEDYKGVAAAERGIDDLFNDPAMRGKLGRHDYRAGKSAWRASKVLDSIHDAVDRSFNTSDETLSQDAGTWRGINGGTLMRGINRITRAYGRAPVEDIIGKDGLTGLLKISHLTQTPQRAALYGEKTGDVLHNMASSNRVGFVPSTIDWARKTLLHQIAINPRASTALEYGIKNNIPARVLVPILTGIMNTPAKQPPPPPPDEDLEDEALPQPTGAK